jgi:hypothetical protein
MPCAIRIVMCEVNSAVPAHFQARNERKGSRQDSVRMAPRACHRTRPFTRLMEESPSGEKLTPGRSTPLDMNTTEDHDRTYESRRLKCFQPTPQRSRASRPKHTSQMSGYRQYYRTRGGGVVNEGVRFPVGPPGRPEGSWPIVRNRVAWLWDAGCDNPRRIAQAQGQLKWSCTDRRRRKSS